MVHDSVEQRGQSIRHSDKCRKAASAIGVRAFDKGCVSGLIWGLVGVVHRAKTGIFSFSTPPNTRLHGFEIPLQLRYTYPSMGQYFQSLTGTGILVSIVKDVLGNGVDAKRNFVADSVSYMSLHRLT
jgi:hypothetical protein